MGPRSEDPWSINEDYQPPEYVLAGGQRDFIATGSSRYDEETPPTEAIQTKVDRLPNRFQDLIDDIALFAYGDYLSATTWEEIVDHTPRAELVHHQNPFFTQPEGANDNIQFGFELGSLLATLQRTATGNPDWKDVVWGVILGFIGSSPGQERDEQAAIDALIDKIEQRATEREVLSMRQQSGVDFFLSLHQDDKEVIKQALRDRDIKPVDRAVELIRRHLREQGTPINQTTITEFFADEVDQPQLELMDEIYTDVITDAQTIVEEGFSRQKVEAEEMLAPLWEADQSLSSHTVAERAGYPTSAGSLATGIFNRLTRSEDHDLWTTHPIVQGDRGGWQTTAYGDLVCELVFEAAFTTDEAESETPSATEEPQESPATWVYEYTLAPEQMDEDKKDRIENVLQELESDDR